MRRKLLDIPKEYAATSITPKGERKSMVRGGIFSRAGYDIVSALKAKPVDHAANAPYRTKPWNKHWESYH